MRTLKLILEYDGTNFVGWQRQARGVSVQGLIEEALAPIAGAPVTLHGAGRTDAGVHALGQVASVSLETSLDTARLHRALNSMLPPEVRVIAAEDADPQFHARFHALSKVYEYRIVNAPFVSPFLHRYAWHVPGPLNLGAMIEAAALFAGRHDFAAFQGSRSRSRISRTERTIHAIGLEPGAGHDRPHVLRIEGDGFLRHMVRTIAGTLVEVGSGRWPVRQVVAALTRRERAEAGPAAPARGLFLVAVRY